ncbi:DNA recombination protein RmuC [Paracoccus nototheniae]|uniref:DNA recombination protein RmuC homolog n=1 Tax=Paracoccus nototheniae TaxID=2489002 RepID=A0ABW4DWT8_9RHOB|nr:DNA recombination protein RmuC [Paracoccus nototheniae]
MQQFGTDLGTWLSDAAVLRWLLGGALALAVILWLRLRRAVTGLAAVQAAGQAQALDLTRSAARIEAAEARLSDLTEDRDGLTDALHQSRHQLAQLETRLAEARLRAEKDAEASAREIATLRELRAEMTQQFKLLSAETLRAQQEDLQRSQNDQLSALLTPFRDQVHRFQTELQTRNKLQDQDSARLHEQILSLHNRSEQISREAVNLTRALKGDKQRQGAWGEMVLERILEDSGLLSDTHYQLQASWRDDDGKLWRPDVVVKMPRGKVMVIDSKVSLNDYEQSVTLESADAAAAALKRHVAAIRAHIATLSAKGYQRMDDNSVDYVLMFIPIEGAFSDALRADPGLAAFAMERRVGLTTPTTLMLTLRTVEHIWAVERRDSNALEIARRAGQLYDKVAGLVEAMEAVGRALDQANRAHGQALDRLTRGPGNVIRQVEMLRALGARSSKEIGLDHDRTDAPDALQTPEAAE